jgi:hypothetical protein
MIEIRVLEGFIDEIEVVGDIVKSEDETDIQGIDCIV